MDGRARETIPEMPGAPPRLDLMPASPLSRSIGAAAKTVPGLKRIPMLKLLVLAEIVLIARSHIERLTPRERRRLFVLMRDGRGRPRRNLAPDERDELEALIAKADPKLFAAAAAHKLSPVPLPKRFRPHE